MERAKAGDKCIFTGALIVIPDVAQLAAPGERLEVVSKVDARNATEGVQGLKALGVRELTYKLSFLSSSVQVGAHAARRGLWAKAGRDGAEPWPTGIATSRCRGLTAAAASRSRTRHPLERSQPSAVETPDGRRRSPPPLTFHPSPFTPHPRLAACGVTPRSRQYPRGGRRQRRRFLLTLRKGAGRTVVTAVTVVTVFSASEKEQVEPL